MDRPLSHRISTFLDISGDFPNPLRSIVNQGFANYLHLRRQRRKLARKWDKSTLPFYSRHARYPLACRGLTPDLKVFSQIFLFREYSCIDGVKNPRLIIDCGANAGYSSAYFLSRHPAAELIAVEPDPENFALLSENLRPYGARARAIQSAIWSHPTRLTLSETPYRDGLELARQVRECQPTEPGGFLATDIGTLLRESGHERISILKIDIEGAEGVVFAKNYESWIDRVDALVIELHDDTIFGDNRAIFARAIAGRGFTVSEFEELTVCKRVFAPAKTSLQLQPAVCSAL